MAQDFERVGPAVIAALYIAAFLLLLAVYLVAHRRQQHSRNVHSGKYEDMSRGSSVANAQGQFREGLLGDTTGFEEETSHCKKYTFSSVGGQMLKYDLTSPLSWRLLFRFNSTVLAHPSVTEKVILTYALSFTAFLLGQLTVQFGLNLRLVDLDEFKTISAFFTSFIGILLGFYMSTMVSRWWSLRNDTLGSLWGAINDICLLMGAHFPGRNWRQIRTLVLRYCLASYELTFMQAQGDDSSLWRLVGRQILMADEAAKLRDLPSRSQAIWAWIASIFHELAEQEHLSTIDAQMFYWKCVQARSAIGCIFTYLNTQLPFVYVQLLTSMVHLLCFVVALEAGVAASYSVTAYMGEAQQPDSGPVVQLLKLTFVPYFYYGCLEIGSALSDPFGGALEFPQHAFHHSLLKEAQAFHCICEEPTLAVQNAMNGVVGASHKFAAPSPDVVASTFAQS